MNNNLEIIWKEFHNKLEFFIHKRVNDKDDAADILQEVFIKIYKNINSLKENQKLTSWIYQITRNTIIDYYRAKKVNDEYSDNFFDNEEDDEEALKRLSPSLLEMIENLPPIYKEAITLTEFNGLKQRELANKLGISLTGAKSRVQRARQQLNKMLLDCCNFEFDSAGKMSDYSQKVNCCVNFTELKKSVSSTTKCTTSTKDCK